MPHATAYKVTEEDIETLVKISPYDERTLHANLNWVVVVDYRHYYPKFHIQPESVFKREYPGVDYSKPVSTFF